MTPAEKRDAALKDVADARRSLRETTADIERLHEAARRDATKKAKALRDAAAKEARAYRARVEADARRQGRLLRKTRTAVWVRAVGVADKEGATRQQISVAARVGHSTTGDAIAAARLTCS